MTPSLPPGTPTTSTAAPHPTTSSSKGAICRPFPTNSVRRPSSAFTARPGWRGAFPTSPTFHRPGRLLNSGHIAASVLNGSDSYFAAGNLAFVANFGNPAASTFSVTDFDGGSFSGTGISIVSASAGHKFSGSITSTVTSASISVSGSYLGSFVQNATGTDKVIETGGHISLTGSGYDASGTFAAAKVP